MNITHTHIHVYYFKRNKEKGMKKKERATMETQ